MRDAAKNSVWAGALALALYFSGFLVFLTPLPFVYLIFRGGRDAFYRPALVTFLCVAAVYLLGAGLLDPLYRQYPALTWLVPIPSLGLSPYFPKSLVAFFGIGYYAFYLAVGFCAATVLSRAPSRPFGNLLHAVAFLGLAVTAVYALLMLPQTEALTADYRAYVGRGIDQLIAAQDRQGADSLDLIYLKSHSAELVRYSFLLIPAFLLSSLVFVFMLNLVMAKRLFMTLFPRLAAVRLTTLRVPFPAVWGVVVLLAALLVNYRFVRAQEIHFLSLNLLLVLAAVYLLQGFAVTVDYLDRRGVFGFMRLGAYLLLFLFLQASALFLVALGFFDTWLDLRKLETPPAPKPGESGRA